jgi:hypothetical protein
MYLDEFPDVQRAKTSVIMYHSNPRILSLRELDVKSRFK